MEDAKDDDDECDDEIGASVKMAAAVADTEEEEEGEGECMLASVSRALEPFGGGTNDRLEDVLDKPSTDVGRALSAGFPEGGAGIGGGAGGA